jgi:hypothetical protein
VDCGEGFDKVLYDDPGDTVGIVRGWYRTSRRPPFTHGATSHVSARAGDVA